MVNSLKFCKNNITDKVNVKLFNNILIVVPGVNNTLFSNKYYGNWQSNLIKKYKTLVIQLLVNNNEDINNKNYIITHLSKTNTLNDKINKFELLINCSIYLKKNIYLLGYSEGASIVQHYIINNYSNLIKKIFLVYPAMSNKIQGVVSKNNWLIDNSIIFIEGINPFTNKDVLKKYGYKKIIILDKCVHTFSKEWLKCFSIIINVIIKILNKKTKRKIHNGPRGGRYYISKGKKVYL